MRQGIEGMANVSAVEIGMALRSSVDDRDEGASASPRTENGFTLVPQPEGAKRDWSAALDLIREASEAIKIRDERATEMEIEHRLDAERASEEIRSLQEQLDESEMRLVETEARLRAAEMRASEAEVWLARMHDSIVTSFGRALAVDSAESELREALAHGLDEAFADDKE